MNITRANQERKIKSGPKKWTMTVEHNECKRRPQVRTTIMDSRTLLARPIQGPKIINEGESLG